MAKFRVDTHLFRELGQLLVGRDSTALVELIKNAYDADATHATIYAEGIDDPERGYIQIVDDGVGMTFSEFEKGFLTIASRAKDVGERRSILYKRRYTGMKGIGRLAAHKLGRVLEVTSIPRAVDSARKRQAVEARIDWDIIEGSETLEEIAEAAIVLKTDNVPADTKAGTTITLRRLRGKWTQAERNNFIAEAGSFEPSPVLVNAVPRSVVKGPLVFETPKVRETSRRDPGFHVELTGEFDIGEDYWQALAETCSWVIEIEALGRGVVRYCVAPTRKTTSELPSATKVLSTRPHPNPDVGPFFQCRILVREGPVPTKAIRQWARRAAGIRVFMEGFRVLPYGELRDDWLSIDFDYARRSRRLPFLNIDEVSEHEDRDVGLSFLPNANYFGAVFLTESGGPTLRMLVNREGFIPDSSFQSLVMLVRTGVDVSVRTRASANRELRLKRRERRALSREVKQPTASLTTVGTGRRVLEEAVVRVTSLTAEAKHLAAGGDIERASKKIVEAAGEIESVKGWYDELITEQAMLNILASVGTQMAAFIHEVRSLVGMAEAVDSALNKLRQDPSLSKMLRTELAKLHAAIGDLQRSLERHASYLTDVITPDARRRRSRQSFAERFSSACQLVEQQAERRGIRIISEIPAELKSPPMFPAELITTFTNLLTNAVKAAGEGGRIRATAQRLRDGQVRLVIENTGVAVDPDKGEHFFKPFVSTTVEVDPVLGQGMGMGLPITRSMLDEYGAEVKFVKASRGYSTAVEILFPQ